MSRAAQRAKSERIDLGLALLAARSRPGQEWSLPEIAAWCGCTWQAIRNIEQQALRRVRQRLAAAGIDRELWALEGRREEGIFLQKETKGTKRGLILQEETEGTENIYETERIQSNQ